ncbi:MAG: arginine--tRNA ligase [Limisphaerales bacterium]|nr:arginine--tRNA ligase [Verrucomicrobiota bacterium]
MLHSQLESCLRESVRALLPDADLSQIILLPCRDARFGDYQTSSLIALAKERKTNPRQLAAGVLEKLSLEQLHVKAELAGPGFINFHLQPQAIRRGIATACKAETPFVRKTQSPQTIVLDFSSPNIAKPMHVGHIRSTLLGSCLSRLHRLIGNKVISDNHIGDWGTQFGKLLLGWKKHLDEASLKQDPIGEMERLYKLVNAATEEDEAVLEAARAELVKLQAGDAENLEIWRQMVKLSQSQFDTLYSRLGISFDYTLGESFYNDNLKGVVEDLKTKAIARESEGAYVVFFDNIPELASNPAIIQKRDGAFNYATTDLATLAYRVENWKPDQILYVTDGRQQLHFKQVFTIFNRWKGNAKVKLEHIWFGTILGGDGKPFKTRSGEVIKLSDLLDEAEERALAVVSEKNPDLPEDTRKNIARVVGIGAVKYADLLPSRQSDYQFNWDKMLAFNGNTAPYLLYAYARIRSIFRKSQEEFSYSFEPDSIEENQLLFTAPQELTLAKHLFSFGIILEQVAEDSRPNILCNYLYDLAGLFASFYENCPVLKASEPEKLSRLTLCHLTAKVLRMGLETLGLETLEEM